jgi:hypothetical protein
VVLCQNLKGLTTSKRSGVYNRNQQGHQLPFQKAQSLGYVRVKKHFVSPVDGGHRSLMTLLSHTSCRPSPSTRPGTSWHGIAGLCTSTSKPSGTNADTKVTLPTGNGLNTSLHHKIPPYSTATRTVLAQMGHTSLTKEPSSLRRTEGYPSLYHPVLVVGVLRGDLSLICLSTLDRLAYLMVTRSGLMVGLVTTHVV